MILCEYGRYYNATIIKIAGVEDTSTAIWLAALTAFVNFIFTFVGLFLVDRIGRRPLTLGSLSGELYSCICICCLSAYVSKITDCHLML